jgi:hypothetical protein
MVNQGIGVFCIVRGFFGFPLSLIRIRALNLHAVGG